MKQYCSNGKLIVKLEASDIAEMIKDKYFKPNPNGNWSISVNGSAEIVIPLADGKDSELR